VNLKCVVRNRRPIDAVRRERQRSRAVDAFRDVADTFATQSRIPQAPPYATLAMVAASASCSARCALSGARATVIQTSCHAPVEPGRGDHVDMRGLAPPPRWSACCSSRRDLHLASDIMAG